MSQSQVTDTSNKSEREKVDEYIAAINIENEQGKVVSVVKNIFVIPKIYAKLESENRRQRNRFFTLTNIVEILNEHGYESTYIGGCRFNFICELYIPTRDENKHVFVEEFSDLYDIFESSFSINNIITQDINYTEPDEKYISINDNYITFQKNNQKYPSNNRLEKLVSRKSSINSSSSINIKNDLICIEDIFDIESLHNSINENLEYIIYQVYDSKMTVADIIPDYEEKIEKRYSNEVNDIYKEIKDSCINEEYLDAKIVNCEVNDKINIFVEVDDINHSEPLVFTFSKPSEDDNSDFIDFTNGLNASSISQLEMKEITLRRYSRKYIRQYDWNNKSNGWSIIPRKTQFQIRKDNILFHLKNMINS